MLAGNFAMLPIVYKLWMFILDAHHILLYPFARYLIRQRNVRKHNLSFDRPLHPKCNTLIFDGIGFLIHGKTSFCSKFSNIVKVCCMHNKKLKIICFFLEHVRELCAIIFIKEKSKRITAYTHTCTCVNAPSNRHLSQCLKPLCNALLLCCQQIETLLELPGHPTSCCGVLVWAAVDQLVIMEGLSVKQYPHRLSCEICDTPSY